MTSIARTSIIALTIMLTACAGNKPNITVPNQPPPHALSSRKSINVALVLGGGGARGYAHAGVISVLQQAGIPIDLIVGTSAGSIFGALYADEGNAPKLAKEMLSATFWDIADIENYPSSGGIIQGYHLQKFLLAHMKARQFKQLKIPLIVATTDLTTGNVYSISSGPIAPAVEASAAIPGLVKPSHLYGKILIDGGMSDPIAVNLAQPYHPKVIIAVNIARQLSPTLPTSASGISKRAGFISRINMTNMSARGANIIIRPQVGQDSVIDIDDKNKLFIAGKIAAKKALPAIKALLKAKDISLNKQY